MSSEVHNIDDYEEVLRVLPKTFQEFWKDNADVLVYLSDLGALGLQRLTQEPERLAEEKSSILEQTQDLAFHNYKTFIQAAECSHEIFQDFNIIETRLDSLLNKLPEFKSKCNEFAKEAQHINTRWHQASSTLAKHQQLLEILEIPQLMDNYVKNEYFDEALELSAYVKRLEKKHSDISLIKSIVTDVQISVSIMLSNLITKLRSSIQLPECLKVVGHLRRMDVFNESELRIKFLQARDSWFQNVVADIEKSDPYQHIIKVIESSRIHLFDIITQYRAIFSEDDPLLLVRGNTENYSAIFQNWITWKISWFLDVLKKDISSNLGGRIDAVLAQCMYFGLSFSRVNVDFRPLLVPIFQNTALLKFQSAVEYATLRFEQSMQTYVISSYASTTFLVASLTLEDSLQPSNSLLDFYPLAQYCNNVLSAFNELKLSVSFSLAHDVTCLLEKSLKRLAKKLLEIYSKRKSISDKENKHFKKFCFHFCSDLVPHLNKCLAVLFPPENISQIFGVTMLEFKKFENVYQLNVKSIIEPLEATDLIDNFGNVTLEIEHKLSADDLKQEVVPQLTSTETQFTESKIETNQAFDNIHDIEGNVSDTTMQNEESQVKNVTEDSISEIEVKTENISGVNQQFCDMSKVEQTNMTFKFNEASESGDSISDVPVNDISEKKIDNVLVTNESKNDVQPHNIKNEASILAQLDFNEETDLSEK